MIFKGFIKMGERIMKKPKEIRKEILQKRDLICEEDKKHMDEKNI